MRAAHHCPLFQKAAWNTPGQISGCSIMSGSTSWGDLPPHSIVTGLIDRDAEAWMTAWPVRVEPVEGEHVDARMRRERPLRRRVRCPGPC